MKNDTRARLINALDEIKTICSSNATCESCLFWNGRSYWCDICNIIRSGHIIPGEWKIEMDEEEET